MKRSCLALSILALACAGWSGIPALADSKGKFAGKGSVEAYNRSCDIAKDAAKLASKGDFNGAISVMRKSIAIYSYDSASYHNLACYQSSLKKFSEAIASEKIALELEPTFVDAWLKEGECYEFSGRLPEAEQCYRTAFKVDSQRWGACFNIGDALLQQNKPKEAKSWFVKSKQLTKNPASLAEVEDRLKKLKPMLEASN